MKRIVLAALVALAGMIACAASAETWKAQGVLLDKSATSCAAYTGLQYTFDLEGATLSVINAAGKMGSTTVAADGSVNFNFKSPTGASLSVTGNAKSKDLLISNQRSGCYWSYKGGA